MAISPRLAARIFLKTRAAGLPWGASSDDSMRIAREGIMPRRMLQPVSSMVIFGLAAFAAGCASPSHPRPPRPLLLTTDAGCEVDDQWALVYLLLAAEEGEIDLR